MKAFCRTLLRFVISDSGPTAVEYAVMVLLIFLAILTAITVFGQLTADQVRPGAEAVISVVG